MAYKFQLASDIHIEKKYPENKDICDFIVPSAKSLILAGDIGSIYYKDQLEFFLRSCTTAFETVIFIPGNNEYYAREGYAQVSFEELNTTLKDMCNNLGVILLNNSYIETEDLIVFGSTWWSSIPEQLNMRIKIGDLPITSDDFNYLHYVSRRALNNVIATKGTKKLLVITHYCPTKIGTMNSHHKRQDFVDLVPYYFSSSEKYLKSGTVDAWIFGHTHVFRDFIFENNMALKTRIISNADPRKGFFKKDYVLEV